MIKFCSLYSGSSGNCIFAGTDKHRILIDAGLSGTVIIDALKSIGEDPQDINAILITHEHSDHIHGAGILSRKFDIPIYANAITWAAMEGQLGKIKEKNRRIIDRVVVKPLQCSFFEELEEPVPGGYLPFEIGEIGVGCCPVPHDAAEPVAYSLHIRNIKISVATDMGHVTPIVKEHIKGSNLVLIESNHDIDKLKKGSYPWPLKRRILGDFGHLSNESAACLTAEAVKGGSTRVVLGHLSQENNIPSLAYDASCSAIHKTGAVIGKDICLTVAARDKVGEVTIL